ncbi:hypothetical protein D3C78_1132570 [compost metagenome]
MWMLMIALLLTVLKLLDVGALAQWSWWWLLVPYGLTAAWWSYADFSGYTRRRVRDAENARVKRRVQRQKDAMDSRKPR